METANTFGVTFLLRLNKPMREGKYPVYAKISANTTKTEMVTRFYFAKKDWNTAKGEVKSKDPELSKVNTHLEKVRSKLTAVFQQMELADEMLTARAVKKKYLHKDKPQKSYTLTWLIKEHNTKMKGTLAPGTLKNYNATEAYVQQLLEKDYTGDVLLRHLEYEFIEELKVYILEHPLKDHDPCTNNGVMKHLERVKKMVRWAVKNRWIHYSPFQLYQLSFDPTDIKFLIKDQLDRMERFLFKRDRLRLVRDLCVFSCYTGMAYGDLMDAGPENIKVDAQGRYWLYTRRGKTAIKADIPLLPTAAKLIEKYKNDPRSLRRGKFFPYVSNQDMNRSLKVIAEILEFDMDLNFHVARHTFATLLIMFGVPVTTVQKIMGHTKLATTMTYVHLMSAKIADDMEDFWKRFKAKPAARKKTTSPLIPTSPLIADNTVQQVA